MRVDAVLETCLYAGDLDTAAAFYADVLGLEHVSAVEGRHIFFQCGAQMVLLFNPETTAREDTLAHGADGPGHVAFVMPEGTVDDWRAHLEAHGVAIEAEVTWPGGGRSLYVRDPAGNSVELANPSIWSLTERT